jgi:hypothetical protein
MIAKSGSYIVNVLPSNRYTLEKVQCHELYATFAQYLRSILLPGLTKASKICPWNIMWARCQNSQVVPPVS